MIANGTDRLKIVEKCVPLDDVLRHIEASPRTDVQTAALALLNAFFIKSNKLPVKINYLHDIITYVCYVLWLLCVMFFVLKDLT